MAALCFLLPALAAHAQYDGAVLTPQARAIAEKLACLVCEGEPITESNSDVAANMRRRVQQMVDEGYTEQQILDKFVEDFGVVVLRDPPKKGIALGVWIVPPLMLMGGIGILVLMLRKWSRQGAEPLAIDNVTADEETESRVESDLRRWEGKE